MKFDLQPTLTDNLVRLRPLRADDMRALYAVARDPLIWEQHPANDRWTRPVFEDFFAGAMNSGGAFIIIDREDEALIGSTRYHGYDEERSEVEIGWTFLARSHWGGQYNRAVKRLMLDHALAHLDRVLLYAGPDNHRSCRAIEKIGGRRDGQRLDSNGSISVRYVVTDKSRLI